MVLEFAPFDEGRVLVWLEDALVTLELLAGCAAFCWTITKVSAAMMTSKSGTSHGVRRNMMQSTLRFCEWLKNLKSPT